MEPKRRRKAELASRHIPSLIVPVPLDESREFVRDALKRTSLVDPAAAFASGWTFFQPYLRFSEADATHTLIEIDVVGRVRGAETLLYTHRIGEIDRFFVAIQDELDRRDRWRPQPPTGHEIESAD